MRLPRPPKHDLIQPEISLKPLVDVCLVLAIILLVVAPMLRTGAEAALPRKPNGATRPVASVLALDEPQLAISMEADGSLYVDGRRVAVRQLQSVLGEIWSVTPNRPVLVKGDRHLRYEQVRWLLQSVSAAGFRRAGLASDRRPGR
jgi:biopolymer transport protein TolR